MKSCLKPVVNFEPNSESAKSYKRFYSKKYQSNNQQKCIDCLKPRSIENNRVCKECGCDYFYVLIMKVFHFLYCPFCSI